MFSYMGKPQAYIELDLSENSSEILHKEPSLLEKLDHVSAQYEQFIEMDHRGFVEEEGNVDNTFFEKRKKQIEDEYISLLCEASPEEYLEIRLGTLDRLTCGIIAEIIKEGRQKERDTFHGEKLFSVFELYMRAKDKRDSN